MMTDKKPCPCSIGDDTKSVTYQECCQPFHIKQQTAVTAEQLMRSRFSAYYYADGHYIYDTHHPDYRGSDKVEDYTQSAKATNWCRLEIVTSEQQNQSAIVEFKAYFINKDKLYCMHERSRFVLLASKWLYTDGDYLPKAVSKISRNDLCPCVSGLKAKKCCLK